MVAARLLLVIALAGVASVASAHHGSAISPITLTDPAIDTQPWLTKTTLRLKPMAEIGEYFCVPSDEEIFRQKMREPAGGVVR